MEHSYRSHQGIDYNSAENHKSLALDVELIEEAEADYYERQASEAKAAEASMGKEAVVDDWESEDELLTQWCTQFD